MDGNIVSGDLNVENGDLIVDGTVYTNTVLPFSGTSVSVQDLTVTTLEVSFPGQVTVETLNVTSTENSYVLTQAGAMNVQGGMVVQENLIVGGIVDTVEVTGLDLPIDPSDGASKEYVDSIEQVTVNALPGQVLYSAGGTSLQGSANLTFNGTNLTLGGGRVTGTGTAVEGTDAVNVDYLDNWFVECGTESVDYPVTASPAPIQGLLFTSPSGHALLDIETFSGHTLYIVNHPSTIVTEGVDLTGIVDITSVGGQYFYTSSVLLKITVNLYFQNDSTSVTVNPGDIVDSFVGKSAVKSDVNGEVLYFHLDSSDVWVSSSLDWEVVGTDLTYTGATVTSINYKVVVSTDTSTSTTLPVATNADFLGMVVGTGFYALVTINGVLYELYAVFTASAEWTLVGGPSVLGLDGNRVIYTSLTSLEVTFYELLERPGVLCVSRGGTGQSYLPKGALLRGNNSERVIANSDLEFVDGTLTVQGTVRCGRVIETPINVTLPVQPTFTSTGVTLQGKAWVLYIHLTDGTLECIRTLQVIHRVSGGFFLHETFVGDVMPGTVFRVSGSTATLEYTSDVEVSVNIKVTSL